MMRVTVNGEAREVADGTTLGVLLDTLGLDLRDLAVAVNHAVVPRSQARNRPLAGGDAVEIIRAVGGG